MLNVNYYNDQLITLFKYLKFTCMKFKNSAFLRRERENRFRVSRFHVRVSKTGNGKRENAKIDFGFFKSMLKRF